MKHLGQTGKCEVEHTEKGPLIQFIDNGPEAISKKFESEKRIKAEKKANIKENKVMEKFMDSLKKADNLNTTIEKDNEDEKPNEISEEKNNTIHIDISLKSNF